MKERKIIAGIASIAMCLSSFTAMTVNAASVNETIDFANEDSLQRIMIHDVETNENVTRSWDSEEGAMKVISTTKEDIFQKLYIDNTGATVFDDELVLDEAELADAFVVTDANVAE